MIVELITHCQDKDRFKSSIRYLNLARYVKKKGELIDLYKLPIQKPAAWHCVMQFTS